MALNGSLTRTAKIALTLTAVWAVVSTGGCVALYAEMQEKEKKWAQERTALTDEYAALADKNSQLTAENAALSEAKDALSGNVAALKTRNTQLDEKVARLNKENSDLRQSGKGLAELQTMIKAAETKLQTATAHRKKVVIEVAAARKSLDETRAALNDNKARIAERRAEIEAAESRLDDLRAAAQSADARIVEARKMLAKLKADFLAREKNIRVLETDLQSARTSLGDAIDRIDKTRKPGS
jgi:chromosome segregation ATPase